MNTVSDAKLFNGGPVRGYHVFSAGQYVGQLDTIMMDGIMKSSNQIYNHCFIYHHEAMGSQHKWWRADGTPFPKEQVPKEYLAYVALLK